MKKLILLVLLVFSIHVSAQIENNNWLTDSKVALDASNNQNKPILVFVTNNDSGTTYDLLNSELFNAKEFKNLSSKIVLLKLDVSNTDQYNKRLAAHYIKHKQVPALALLDSNGNTIGNALINVNSESIATFMSFISTKL
ncbi:thioredoxin family protein [uncultured Psychroserpens sp.]|uniref:thioredoxin family protein n=1 Tax=uncultured Psychroserpens sp. TaxID=255436 RepID=UPI002621B202|nr:thioredoxin family protein [uncultured Psychroserpens sp.]